MTASTPENSKDQNYYTAGQFALIRARFVRKPVAMFGAMVLFVLLGMGLFAPFISPVEPTSRGADTNYIKGPPQWFKFRDANGEGVTPYLCTIEQKLNLATLTRERTENCSERRSLVWFPKGWEYDIVNIRIPFTDARIKWSWDRHLFGLDEGTIHLFGTDDKGKDVFARTLHAIWISLSIAALALVIKLTMSLIVGGTAGFFGGTVDAVLMMFTDAVRAIPSIPVYLAFAVAMPQSWSSETRYFAIAFIIGFLDFGALGRRLRTHLLTERAQDYVLAARLSGSRPVRTVSRHLIPSFASYIIVDTIINFPYQILAETSLSFLGLGLSEPVNSLGVLMKAAQDFEVQQSLQWQLIPVGFFVAIVLAFVLVGDGLRDAADPYQEKRR